MHALIPLSHFSGQKDPFTFFRKVAFISLNKKKEVEFVNFGNSACIVKGFILLLGEVTFQI
jgi:hypothetical protein